MKEQTTGAHVAPVCRVTDPASTVEECKQIVRAECNYWLESGTDISITAVGALANVTCGIMGIRAPWHPEPLPEEPSEVRNLLSANLKLQRLTVAARDLIAGANLATYTVSANALRALNDAIRDNAL